MPRGWREEETSDDAEARWDRWRASEGDSEAEGDEPWPNDEGATSSADEGDGSGDESSDSDPDSGWW